MSIHICLYRMHRDRQKKREREEEKDRKREGKKRTHAQTVHTSCMARHTHTLQIHTHTHTTENTFCISLTQSHTRAHTRIRTSKHKQAQIKRQHRPHATPLSRTLSCRSSLAPADISLSATSLCPLKLAQISADHPFCRPQET